MNAALTSSLKTHAAQLIRLYRSGLSGHCHRVELFLSMLGLPFELVNVDLAVGSHKRPDFLAMNPFGEVPVIQDSEVTLADSNAILVYLARRYAADVEQWLPSEPLAAAHVQCWLSVASGLLAFGPAYARVIQLFKSSTSLKDAIARAQTCLKSWSNNWGSRHF